MSGLCRDVLITSRISNYMSRSDSTAQSFTTARLLLYPEKKKNIDVYAYSYYCKCCSIKFSVVPDTSRVLLRCISTILVIFLNLAMFYNRSESPQIKRNLISSIRKLVYKLPHELPNDL